MGKYDAVISSLPMLPPEVPAYQQKIDQLKTELRTAETWTPESLARAYAAVRRVKDELKDELAVVQERLTAYEQMLCESLDQDEPGWGMYGAGPTTVQLPDGASVAVQFEPQGKVEDKEAFRLWCIAPADVCMTCGEAADDVSHGDERDTQHAFKPGGGLERSLQLWPSTMNAIVKERLLEGEPPPDGVAAFAFPKIVYRKG